MERLLKYIRLDGLYSEFKAVAASAAKTIVEEYKWPDHMKTIRSIVNTSKLSPRVCFHCSRI